ncbi:MAG: putative ABC transporter permease [Clostridia bacterium]
MKDKENIKNNLNFLKLFWLFFIGCFAGVIVETLWCIITNGYFESRTALILEPLNPIYGFGAVLITLCFSKLKNNIIIFVGCMFVGGIFEYLCSLFQETIFGTVSWYYSADSLGIFERTSLIYCIFWGILGIVWVNFIYPYFSKLIDKILKKVGNKLTYVLIAIVTFDCIFSSGAVYRQSQRRKNIEATNIIDEFYDKNYNDNVLKIIYPKMSVVK